MPDTDGVIARFTDGIWPAVNAYNGVHSQGGPSSQAFHAVIDPQLRSASGTVDDLNTYSALRDAAQGLGQAGYDSVLSGNPFRDPGVGLRLGDVAVTSVNPPAATVKVCYTYSLVDRDHASPPQPTASEITVGLVDVDSTWYLHSISNDHVVPGCGTVDS